MKILVGNNALGDPGGSETFTYALVMALIKKGHEVECVARRGGMVSNKLKAKDVPVHFSSVRGKFDLLLLSHYTSIELAQNAKGFKVQTCHGVFVGLEKPVYGMDQYVAVSEEVRKRLSILGYASELIRNGVDCERFTPRKPINGRLDVIASFSHSERVNTFLKDVFCKKRVIVCNKYKSPVWNVDIIMNEADLVVSLGRGCYEAMACGRNVFIFDERTYSGQGAVGDGLVTKDNVSDFLKNNCSGRFSKKKFSPAEFVEEANKYNKKHGEDLRKYALENLNIDKQADKYLSLMR